MLFLPVLKTGNQKGNQKGGSITLSRIEPWSMDFILQVRDFIFVF